MKTLRHIVRDAPAHWVGDGFPVRTLISAHSLGAEISPFLLLDYAGPRKFEPSPAPRGVEEHPHRGFETVTIVYHGSLDHRDSAGNAGTIGPGDVQWMTAASGVVHEEMHGRDFTRKGGAFEVVQLWVNLPAKLKMSKPRYQELLAKTIPVAPLPNDAGTFRVIAGRIGDVVGPAKTHTPVDLWDLRLKADRRVELPAPEGATTAFLVLNGGVTLDDGTKVGPAELALFDRAGQGIAFRTDAETTLLLIGGEPIDEPIASYGPFVMNTQDEIRQAIADYQAGRMGHLAAV
jgi:quercetin 2,3-dioxygenase